jgi:hypothetical protein
MRKIAEKMALRGNSPKPDPRSECPQRGRYFEGERCPHCRYKRGDWDKRSRRKRLMLVERALEMLRIR